MKFKVNDKEYFVKWEYPDPNRTFTVCKIYDIQTSYDNPIVEDYARLGQGDRFCKNTGRKVSLSRALNKLFVGYSGYKARSLAWAEYFKESPKRLNN